MLVFAVTIAVLALIIANASAVYMIFILQSYRREIAPMFQRAREIVSEDAIQRGERLRGDIPPPTRGWDPPQSTDPGALSDWLKAYQRASNEPTDVRMTGNLPWDHDERIEEEEHEPAPGSKAAQPPPG